MQVAVGPLHHVYPQLDEITWEVVAAACLILSPSGG